MGNSHSRVSRPFESRPKLSLRSGTQLEPAPPKERTDEERGRVGKNDGRGQNAQLCQVSAEASVLRFAAPMMPGAHWVRARL